MTEQDFCTSDHWQAGLLAGLRLQAKPILLSFTAIICCMITEQYQRQLVSAMQCHTMMKTALADHKYVAHQIHAQGRNSVRIPGPQLKQASTVHQINKMTMMVAGSMHTDHDRVFGIAGGPLARWHHLKGVQTEGSICFWHTDGCILSSCMSGEKTYRLINLCIDKVCFTI